MQMRTALTEDDDGGKSAGDAFGFGEDVWADEYVDGVAGVSACLRFPSAYLEREDYLQIWRLLDAGTPVQLELNVQSSFSGKPVEVYNTVAEIRGTENRTRW